MRVTNPDVIEVANAPVAISLWHVDGTTFRRTPSDQGVHAFHQDMNKIMMAVLQALQDEQVRHAEKLADQGGLPS